MNRRSEIGELGRSGNMIVYCRRIESASIDEVRRQNHASGHGVDKTIKNSLAKLMRLERKAKETSQESAETRLFWW